MENTVVVGGAVKGDISSCSFQVSALTTNRPDIWKYEQTTLAVNNCSGEVIKGTDWGVSEFGMAVLIICGLFIAIILGCFSTRW